MFELILPHLPLNLQEAILSPDYSEVCVNEDGRVFVEAAGANTMLELAGIAPTQMQLRNAVNAIAPSEPRASMIHLLSWRGWVILFRAAFCGDSGHCGDLEEVRPPSE